MRYTDAQAAFEPTPFPKLTLAWSAEIEDRDTKDLEATAKRLTRELSDLNIHARRCRQVRDTAQMDVDSNKKAGERVAEQLETVLRVLGRRVQLTEKAK